MTQVVNHKGKRLKVGPRGGGYHIYIYVPNSICLGGTISTVMAHEYPMHLQSKPSGRPSRNLGLRVRFHRDKATCKTNHNPKGSM